jgi:hypothetical protein
MGVSIRDQGSWPVRRPGNTMARQHDRPGIIVQGHRSPAMRAFSYGFLRS